MKFFLTLTILIFSFGCQNNLDNNPKESSSNKLSANKSDSLIGVNAKIKDTPTEWNSISVNNFTFSLPNNFEYQTAVSNENRKVYLDSNANLCLTIDMSALPSGYEESKIFDLITDLKSFGVEINNENKKLFNDFHLDNTSESRLGNIKSILVNQTSTLVSGKNILMNTKTHFVISKPFYCSLNFVYPKRDLEGEKIMDKIMKSFKFE